MPGDLLAILSHGASSMAAHRAASATASHNLQNASTPGYARQRAELEAVVPAEIAGRGYLGRGVTLTTISQARDRFLEHQIPGALGAHARSSAEASALEGVSAFDPNAKEGIGAALSEFYSALRVVAQAAGNPGLRQAAVGAASRLAGAFNRTAASLASARAGVDARVAGIAREANEAAATVARLNREIPIARVAGGGEPNDLLDARQRAVDRLAELVGGVPIPNGNGDVNISLPGGASLVSGQNAARLVTAPDPGNGGLLAVSLVRPDGSPAVALTGMGGEIGGLLDARDGAMAAAEQALDTLAFDLGTALNTVNQAGFGLDGAAGGDMFAVGAGAAGAARRIAIDPALRADPGRLAAAAAAGSIPGDARNLQALIATERQALSTGVDAQGALAAAVTAFGASTSRARATSEQDGAIAGHLQAMRESVSGVSIDEEMVNLTKAQRAFEATMKVITTADEMLETLMSLK